MEPCNECWDGVGLQIINASSLTGCRSNRNGFLEILSLELNSKLFVPNKGIIAKPAFVPSSRKASLAR